MQASVERKVRQYEVVAISIPVIFNKYRDHDSHGMMYALKSNLPTLQHHAEMYRNALSQARRHHEEDACGCSETTEHGHHVDPAEVFKPHALVRPLVLRAAKGETVEIVFTNLIKCRKVGIHLVGPGTDKDSDGTKVGENTSSLVKTGNTIAYRWTCEHEGVFPFHDMGDPDGDEDGTNAHGLFGALIVEPEGSRWTDSSTGASVDDGLFVDVHQKKPEELRTAPKTPFAGKKGSIRPPKYPNARDSFREYVVFIHDEPEVMEMKHRTEEEYRHCHGHQFHEAVTDHDKNHKPDFSECHHAHIVGPTFSGVPKLHCEPDHAYHQKHEGHEPHFENEPVSKKNLRDWRLLVPHAGSLMCLNYRSEPMKNREHQIWERLAKKELKRTVINEEQHHSSWMFGDPDTPILKAYIGDPIRIRLIHAGVKETHVFHLHVYEWHADPANHHSPLIDAITISPGTGHTIQPLFGAGNVQAVPGDVIWHCHLYPHFHMGMWGMLRSFDKLQDGKKGVELQDPSGIYNGRYIGRYPDGTTIERLAVLPDREAPPIPTVKKPGFPLFIGGEVHQKSPVPPWPLNYGGIPAADRGQYDYRDATQLEIDAMNSDPKPGELFTIFPNPDQRSLWVPSGNSSNTSKLVVRKGKGAQVNHKISVGHGRIEYNSHGWHDPDGHFYYMDNGESTPQPEEPLFFRANQGDVLNLTFSNKIGFRTPKGPFCAADGSPVPSPKLGQLERMYFDYNLPPSDNLVVNSEPLAECGLHVHLVKFDPICADGASTGWNYMSAPSDGKKMVYRWWCDEEFGVIFCHDHCFANTRQRHGLFGSLIVEPENAKFLDPYDKNKKIIAGQKAVIERSDGSRFREFCIGVGDWIAMYNQHCTPLEFPDHPSSHDDNGVMSVNYRSAPLKERGDKPERWFLPDQDTITFDAHAGDPIYIRLVQGSHEEQHSFQINGLRWHRFRKDPESPLRSQQTTGISEAFTFVIEQPYSTGDYLWRFAGQDDTWLGCWGLIKAHKWSKTDKLWPLEKSSAVLPKKPPLSVKCRRYKVKAVSQKIVYRGAPKVLADKRGMRFIAMETAAPAASKFTKIKSTTPAEPLIIRCLEGEWVEIIVSNKLARSIKAEKHWPELPVEEHRDDPPISRHVSLEADLLAQYVRGAKGKIGRPQPPVTVPPGGSVTYLFHANVKPGAVLLQDMADIRNHRHHGLFGTLIVEPKGTVPLAVSLNKTTAADDANEAWTGQRATLLNQRSQKRTEECVLLLHDGIRYYTNGKENEGKMPRPSDIPGDIMGEAPDTEDQGHKAFNYRSARIDNAFKKMKPCKDEGGKVQHPNPHDRQTWNWFENNAPTPTFNVSPGADVEVKLVCAADKPRNHSFTIHGHSWKEYPHRKAESSIISAENGLSTGASRTLAFKANNKPGDYLYRSGVLKWTIAQGAWGILRVDGKNIAAVERKRRV
jgi:manganese oxidase